MKLRILIIALIAFFNVSTGFAKATLLVYDKSNPDEHGLPFVFKDLGILGINAISSAQFSESELQKIKEKYPKEDIIIVDLRQESHGFINGKAVAWRSELESANADKKISEILQDEKTRLQLLKKWHEIVIHNAVKVDKKVA